MSTISRPRWCGCRSVGVVDCLTHDVDGLLHSSWPVLAQSIDAVYAKLAGTSPYLRWKLPDEVDLSCRFRAAAHLF